MRLHHLHGRAAALVALAALACHRDAPRRPSEPPAPPRVMSAPPARGPAPTTALISLLLSPDGSARIDAVSPRSFPFEGGRRPWTAPVVTSSSPQAAPLPALGGRVAPAPALSSGSTPAPAGAVAARPPVLTARYLIVVSGGALEASEAVSLALAAPGSGGGDVADPWQNGSLIVHAPHYGPGTRYRFVAETADGARLLAESTP